MIWKDFLWKWKNIRKVDKNYSIFIENIKWRELWSSDSQKKKQFFHWSVLSPTLANSRKIIIEGIIRSDDRKSLNEAMFFLDNFFALQEDFSRLEENEFEVIDESDNRWKCLAKVKSPIEYKVFEDDFIDGADRWFRVVLEAWDPLMYSSKMNIKEWLEKSYWGYKFPWKWSIKLNEKRNQIEVNSVWNFSSPCKIEIKVKKFREINSPLTIENKTTNEKFILDINWVEWDVILIDGYNFKAEKNSKDILYKRQVWSTFPRIKWKNIFSIKDKEWWLYWSDFDVKIYFNNILL